MGQEIVYCYKCQKRVLGAEFAKGLAYQVGNNVSCSGCAGDLLQTLPPRERDQLLAKMFKATQQRANPQPSSSPPDAPVVQERGGGSDRSRTTSRRVNAPVPRGPRSGPTPVALGMGIAGVVVVIVLFLVAGSGDRKEPPEPSAAQRSGSPSSPEPIPLSPEETRQIEAARAAVKKARDFAKANPEKLEGQIHEWEQALWAGERTPFLDEIKREMANLTGRRKSLVTRELAEMDVRILGRIKGEEFKAASDLYQTARNRYDTPEWSSAIDRKIREIYDGAAQLLPAIKVQAVTALGRQASGEVQLLRERVLKWGFPEFAAELESALAAVIPKSSPPPPVTASPRSKEAEAYLSRWEGALALAASRDYPAPIKEMTGAMESLVDPTLRAEATADLETLRTASAVFSEAQDYLSKFTKGQKLSLEYWNPSGEAHRADGTVLRMEPHRMVLKVEEGVVAIELGELTPDSLTEIFRARPQRKPESDARSSALFCIVEGDPDVARKILGDQASTIPKRYWDYAENASRAWRRPEVWRKEETARRLFYAAEDAAHDYAKTASSIQSCNSLLSEYAATRFVGRNRASISSRLGAGKEYLFLPVQMQGAGSFKLATVGKMEACWTSERDSDPSRLPENYVELSYSSLPGNDYRCWIYAGACCLETFSMSIQATGLTIPNPRNPKDTVEAEPGSDVSLAVRVSVYLRKNHSMHGGPKTPARWEWIPIPLPKNSAPGVKILRVLTDQQGFSVAYAVISSRRTSPPTESDIKDFQALRLETPTPPPVLDTPQDADLVGYWSFDEGAGATAADGSGRGHKPALLRGATWVAGRRGSAIHVDGVNSYAELPTAPVLDKLQEGNYTIVAWFKPDNVPPGKNERDNDACYSIVIKQGAHEGLLYTNRAGFSMAHVLAGPTSAPATTLAERTFAPGIFYHVAGVVNQAAGTTQVYVNGRLEGTRSWAPGAPCNNFGDTPWRIGIAAPGAGTYRNCAKGIIDEVRLYSRALGGQEIAALYGGRVISGPSPRASAKLASADAAEIIFSDTLGSHWNDIGSWNCIRDLASANPAYLGKRTILLKFDPGWGGLYLQTDRPIDSAQFPYLYLVAQATQPGQHVGIAFTDQRGKWQDYVRLSELGGDPPAGSWKEYCIPLESLGGDGRTVVGLIIREITGSPQPPISIGCIKLLKKPMSNPAPRK